MTLKDIAARAPAVEAAYCAALEQVVSIAGELLELQSTYDAKWSGVHRFQHANGLAGHGLRRPSSPPIPPEVYFRASAPYIAFEQWLAEERQSRGITAL